MARRSKVKILKERDMGGYRERLIRYRDGHYGIEGAPLYVDGGHGFFTVYGGTVGFTDSVFLSRESAEMFWDDIEKNLNKKGGEWVLWALGSGNKTAWNKYWKRDYDKLKKVI